MGYSRKRSRWKRNRKTFTFIVFLLQDYPFLRHHKPRKGVITMENGEMVAVCLDCFDSLRSQFDEGEKLRIPVETRKYNWMQVKSDSSAAAATTAAASDRPISTTALARTVKKQ